MFRCTELAWLGAAQAAPNPMVGSVLVHEDRIIGEGYHRQYGQAHAEVNCLASVKPEDRPLISDSTLYVSLEPCAHFGKTPPCADLIIKEKIPRVVIGCRDPFPEVDGKGMDKMRAAGIEVRCGVLEAECKGLNKRFFTFHTRHRPYVVLKWAQTANGRIAGAGADRVLITNELSNRLVHKWRTEEMAILVGTRTAMLDDPSLTARLWPGRDPIRLVIDKELRLPPSLHLFDDRAETIVFNTIKHEMREDQPLARISHAERHEASYPPRYYQLGNDSSLVDQLMVALYRLGITSVLVEGGARVLQSFIDAGCWDEARVITNEELLIPSGLPAPLLGGARASAREQLHNDRVAWYINLCPR